jgi:hypothetical protein
MTTSIIHQNDAKHSKKLADPNKKKIVETIKQIENTTNHKNTNPILTVQQILDRFKKMGIDIDLGTFLKETESGRKSKVPIIATIKSCECNCCN